MLTVFLSDVGLWVTDILLFLFLSISRTFHSEVHCFHKREMMGTKLSCSPQSAVLGSPTPQHSKDNWDQGLSFQTLRATMGTLPCEVPPLRTLPEEEGELEVPDPLLYSKCHHPEGY
jgi:hypothetical protein